MVTPFGHSADKVVFRVQTTIQVKSSQVK